MYSCISTYTKQRHLCEGGGRAGGLAYLVPKGAEFHHTLDREQDCED
jgi:hypothetical protein